ncbi:MAG: hypothetical protein JNL98_40805, partial [Bryobacterales bacterium]|nr:hypothetical protein [Bryobacterales bacterium]
MYAKLLFLLAYCLYFCIPLRAETWLKLTSPNFEMYTTNGERTARDAVLHFEQVRQFFVKAMKLSPADATKVRIIAFRSENEYRPYRPNENAFAFYTKGYDTDYIVMQQVNSQYYPVVVHEYVHFLIRGSQLENIPAWLNEGLADVYSTLRPVGNKVHVGAPLIGRGILLLNSRWLPIATLVNVNHKSPEYNEKDRAGLFYAQSWLLTNMLYLGNDYRAKFADLVTRLVGNSTAEEAFSTVYGKSLAQVEKDMQAYLRQELDKVAVFDVALEKAAERPQVSPAAPYEVDLNLARLTLLGRKYEEARAKFNVLAQSSPERWEAHEAAGYVALYERDRARACEHFGHAMKAGGPNPRMYHDYASAVESSGVDRKELVTILRRGLELDPADVRAKSDLARVLAMNGDLQEALVLLKSVKSVDKKNAFLFFYTLAYVTAQAGDRAEAGKASDRAGQFAEDDGDKLAIAKLKSYLDQVAVAGAAKPVAMRPRPVEPASAGSEQEQELSRPTIRRAPALQAEPQPVPAPPPPSVEGSLLEVECLGRRARLHVSSGGRTLLYLVRDPDSVVIRSGGSATVEFTCGKQKGQP